MPFVLSYPMAEEDRLIIIIGLQLKIAKLTELRPSEERLKMIRYLSVLSALCVSSHFETLHDQRFELIQAIGGEEDFKKLKEAQHEHIKRAWPKLE